MKIKEFRIRHKLDFEFKSFQFDENLVFMFSNKNGKGKTTFLRGILYSLGFNVPNTKKVDFAQYEFETVIQKNNQDIIIRRHGNVIEIDGISYAYPNDYDYVISNIFGISNIELISNILGAIYIDQEKGWTLLNRGKIIGDNGFHIESFLRGLNDCNVMDLTIKEKKLSNEIKKYRLIQDVAEYQNEIRDKGQTLGFESFDEELEINISVVENEIQGINKKINQLQSIRRENNKFADYIDSMGLQVKIGDEVFIINKENLLDFKDINTIANLQLNELLVNREEFIKQKEELVAQRKEITIVDVKTVLDHFNFTLKNIDINKIQTAKIIAELNSSRLLLKKQIETITKENNPYINKINKIIKKYWEELKIEIEYTDDYLFTHDLKSLSGAVLYKMIVAYKLAYIFVLQEKINEKIPVFIDSPGGREVETDTINKVLTICKRDLVDNQLFICSILELAPLNAKKEQIIDFMELKAFDRHSVV